MGRLVLIIEELINFGSFYYFVALIFDIMLILLCIKMIMENIKVKNNVHFYVARDMSGSLWLYIGKPIRFEKFFACGHGQILVSSDDFPKYGLNIHDFDNLKWEDGPLEVFVNMED